MNGKAARRRVLGEESGTLQSHLSRLSRLLPFFLIAVGIAFQIATPAQLSGTPFFIAAPLMAAPLFSTGQTVAIGGLALATAVALWVIEGEDGDPASLRNSVTQLTTIVFVTAIAVLLNVVVRRGRDQLASSREVAEAAQRAVLPTPAENISGLRVAARYEAAQREALIGGDLYGVRPTPFGVRLVMGDVRGKGIAAIETVSVVLGAFREAADQEETLPAVARRLEWALDRERLARAGADDPEDFVTCVLVEIPAGHRVVRVLNCGHPAPLLLDVEGRVTALAPRSFRVPLGMTDLAPAHHGPDTWDFPPQATLLLYTDGISEARDAAGAFYDPAAWLTGRGFPTPARLLSTLVDDVRRFSGGLTTDDTALLAVYRPLPHPVR